MAKPTGVDVYNALLYVENVIANRRIKNLIKSDHFFFTGITIIEKPWTGVEAFSKAKDLEPLYEYRYDEQACKRISCHPFTGRGSRCPLSPESDTYVRNYGDYVPCCQASCYQSLDGVDKEQLSSPFLDTAWENGRCVIVNRALKTFCMHPKWRGAEFAEDPPFRWEPSTQSCSITKEYCDYYGTDFDSNTNDCVRTGVQAFSEDYLFGKTITRFFRGKPDGYRWKRSATEMAAYVSVEMSLPYQIKLMNAIHAKTVANLGYKPTLTTLRIASLKTVSLYKGSRLGGSLAVRFISANQIARNLLGITARKIATCLKVMSSTSLSLFMITLVGIVLDVLDVGKYNLQLDKDAMNKSAATFWKAYNIAVEGHRDRAHLTPDSIYKLMSKREEDESGLEQQIIAYEYFESLKVNSRGQLLEVGDDESEMDDMDLPDVRVMELIEPDENQERPFRLFIVLLGLLTAFMVSSKRNHHCAFALTSILIVTMSYLYAKILSDLADLSVVL